MVSRKNRRFRITQNMYIYTVNYEILTLGMDCLSVTTGEGALWPSSSILASLQHRYTGKYMSLLGVVRKKV
jgi:hypothetical protein